MHTYLDIFNSPSWYHYVIIGAPMLCLCLGYPYVRGKCVLNQFSLTTNSFG